MIPPTIDIEIFKLIDAGTFWAHPTGHHGNQIQDVIGRLNDFFRNGSTPQVQPKKGQMCVIQRTSDNFWYRARVQNVLQTLSGPQASVFLVDLAESTLVPYCRIREVPAIFQDIPVQAMECCLAGLKPLGLATSYFDLTTSKQITDHWDEAATVFLKNIVQGSKLQVTIQKQDEKGRHHVLLLSDSTGHSQVCVNDELVIKGFAVYSSQSATSSAEPIFDISPDKAAKLQAMNEKFQKQGSEVIRDLKEYVSHGKRSASEESPSTDDETADYNRLNHRHLSLDTSPLDILRRHCPEFNSYGARQGSLHGPVARIPDRNPSEPALHQLSPEKPIHVDMSGSDSGKEPALKRPSFLTSEESCGKVRFVSARLPATGSSSMSVRASRSPDSTTLKPILKRTSSFGTHQSSGGSSSDSDGRLERRSSGTVKVEDNVMACDGTPPGTLDCEPFTERTSPEKRLSACSGTSSSAVLLFDGPDKDSWRTCVGSSNNIVVGEESPCESSKAQSSENVVSLIESLRDATVRRYDKSSLGSSQFPRTTSSYNEDERDLPCIGEPLPRPGVIDDDASTADVTTYQSDEELRATAAKHSLVKNWSSLGSSSRKSPISSAVPSVSASTPESESLLEINLSPGPNIKVDERSLGNVTKDQLDKELCATPAMQSVVKNQSSHGSVTDESPMSSGPPSLTSSAQQSLGGISVSFSDGVVIQIEGAPAPRPITSLENCPLPDYLRRIKFSSPSLIQSHVWPALRRGRDVVGISPPTTDRTLAYLLPIISQITKELQVFAELPPGNGPLLLVMVSGSNVAVDVYQLCLKILAKNRHVRTQIIFASGAEEEQILSLVNGCEILIATPPCFLRMVKKSYTSFNRLCYVVFHDADFMVEDFTLEIKEIMRHYARLLKSQPCRSAPRQAVVMGSSWTVGVASLVRAYLGNPVCIIADMFEAAVYGQVQQIATVCPASQRDVNLLGYLESFSSTKDVCIFTSTASEADKIGELLEANAYYNALVAHEYHNPRELASVSRQWNTPYASDAMPVLVMTDLVLEQMNIRNASCIIHYNIPAEKAQFGQRFTALAETFTSSKEHGCISVTFVTEEKFRLSPFILQLAKRSGQEVPPLLEEMAEIATQDREKKNHLCHSLKAFGTCRFKKGTRNCFNRHSVLPDYDKPLETVPTSGIVKILIMSVMDASCYWVRLLEHKPSNQRQSSNVPDSSKFLEFTLAISRWYADPDHRVKHELIGVGTLCAVQDDSTFHRVKVYCVTERDSHNNKPVRVEVHFVDRGDFQVVHVDKLLQLPPDFYSCPFQAIQVYLCRVQPLDKDLTWTDQASYFVKRLIEGKEMEGRVVLSLGDTMWLDPLVERTYLETVNVTTTVSNMRLELLRKGFATDNKQHIKMLKALCENVIDLPTAETETSGTGDTSSEGLSTLETVVLAEDRYQDVYVCAVENPGLFFVQLSSSQESLEDLRAKIDSEVGKRTEEGGEITIGSLCVARFTQDDKWYRARVLGSRPENEYDVFFVDFGDREWVPRDRIVPAWNSVLKSPLQAVECSLVNVAPFGSDWSEEDNDAFWEMVFDKQLVAKVKSKCTSLVAGCHRFVIELYDTTTEHDVVLSQEVVATGHAQTSLEATQILFPLPSSEEIDENLPFQRIPALCLEAHKCQELSKKIEILKELQSVVLNSESEKDAIREYGGVHALCRLLSFNRAPLVLQHILASLASLAFENENNCDKVRMYGGLRTMCYLLKKVENSAVQESLAWALKNLAICERNQDETRNQGGLKGLCEILQACSDDKVQARVTWALGCLVKDNDRNCQAVEEYGGLRTLCELVSILENEDALERATWALAALGALPSNRNFIRQHGGIENIYRRLQDHPSEQFVKQGALTLKIMASNNQSNKDLMCRLGVIGTLQSLMADDSRKLGIICRRVCWDLLQRLLSSAACAAQLTTSHPSVTHVNGIKKCSSSPGGVDTQRTGHTAMVNGFADSDDEMPALEGEDSDTEIQTTALCSDRQRALRSIDCNDHLGHNTLTNGTLVASPNSQVRNGARSIENESEVAEPFSVHPRTVWSQTRDLVRVCVKLRGVVREETSIADGRVVFRTLIGCTLYELDLQLYDSIDAAQSRVSIKGGEVQILLKKRNHHVWPRLLHSKEKVPYVSIDFDRWEVWSSSEEDEENSNNRNANAPARLANPKSLRASRSSKTEPSEEGKQIFVPEMLSSTSDSSNSGDESIPSDVDSLQFF